jgi:hypothetical protein
MRAAERATTLFDAALRVLVEFSFEATQIELADNIVLIGLAERGK